MTLALPRSLALSFSPALAAALLCALLSLPAGAGTAGQAALPPTLPTTLPLWNAATLTRVCDDGLVELRRQVQALENLPLDAAAADTVFHAWNALQIRLEDIESPVYLLNNVSPDPAVRAAADACLLEYNRFGSALYQNAAIYQRVRAVAPQDAVDARLKKDLLEAFEDTGVSLSPEKQARIQQILERLEQVRQEFDRNIRDNKTRLSFTPAELGGLPQAYLERATRDERGNYLLGFEYPEYGPFMENADDEAARQRYQFAFVNRGGPRNLELLDEVVALRHEMAGLYGLPSYADFVIRRRMAGTPAKVHEFLGEVMDQVRQLEARDLEELRQAKAAHTGRPLAGTTLERWDVAYYQERLRRQRYDIDQEALRRHFPTAAAIGWAMDLSARLYGIEFREAGQEVAVWHPEVRYYDVIDRETGEFLGGIYLDPYPREGKYGHAAAFGVRGASRLAGRTPISVLVANFDRQGLNFNELETLVHEFGHVMHGVLSRTRYVDHAGTRVETDFVEAPSQMYEEWARRLESVGRIARFCAAGDCAPVDAGMMQRLNAARNFGRGIHYARQHLYASYDMALYGPQPGKALAVWQRMEAATPLGHTPDTAFPGQFSHIIRGYGAGYYGYMWSEVLALDMLSQYGDDLMNPAVGQRFRREILERGGERGGAEMARSFLGRAPSSQAFFDEIAGRRQK